MRATSRVAVLGSGAVGGYYGALLARAGHDVVFIARGAHGEAIRASGLRVRGPLGDWTVNAQVESDTSRVGPADLVLVAVKAYDNPTALPLLLPLAGPDTLVLTLQNGVDSPDEAAAIVGRDPVIGGATYIATAVVAPGIIEQTGTYRRIVFGEVFDPAVTVSPRTATLAHTLAAADIQAEAVADGRVPLWEKFVYLAPMAGMTGAARQPVGAIRRDPVTRRQLYAAFAEVERVGRAEGVPMAADLLDLVSAWLDGVPETMRSSLLIDLAQGKRIEVEALQGSVVRRAARVGVPVPVMETLYAVLRAAAGGG
jgi:2-dehydropantoate 2-reductase